MRYLIAAVPPRMMAFDSKSEIVVASLKDRTLSIWDRESDQPIARLTKAHAFDAAFVGQGNEFRTWTSESTRLWLIDRPAKDATRVTLLGEPLRFALPMGSGSYTPSPILAPTGNAFFSRTWHSVVRFDVSSPKWDAFTILQSDRTDTRMCIHPDGHTIALVETEQTYGTSLQSTLRVWDLSNLTPVPSVSITVASLRTERRLSDDPVFTTGFDQGMVYGLSYSSDGSRLLIVGSTWCDIRTVPDYGIASRIVTPDFPSAWAISPNGRIVLIGSHEKREVVVYDGDTGSEQSRFSFNIGRITQLRFAPDGLTAAACGSTRTIVVWDVE